MITSANRSREDVMMAAFSVPGLRAALILSALAFCLPASAQTYPARPIRLIVPFAAAGPTDVIARIVAQKLSDAWGQQVYIENLPGAGGKTGNANDAQINS